MRDEIVYKRFHLFLQQAHQKISEQWPKLHCVKKVRRLAARYYGGLVSPKLKNYLDRCGGRSEWIEDLMEHASKYHMYGVLLALVNSLPVGTIITKVPMEKILLHFITDFRNPGISLWLPLNILVRIYEKHSDDKRREAFLRTLLCEQFMSALPSNGAKRRTYHSCMCLKIFNHFLEYIPALDGYEGLVGAALRRNRIQYALSLLDRLSSASLGKLKVVHISKCVLRRNSFVVNNQMIKRKLEALQIQSNIVNLAPRIPRTASSSTMSLTELAHFRSLPLLTVRGRLELHKFFPHLWWRKKRLFVR